MEPNERDDGRSRPRVISGSVMPAEVEREKHREQETDLVFDFSDLHPLELADLALVLTARLRAAPGDRVWVRALPQGTWRVLRTLGLAHLFRFYPTPGDELN
jgi:hypothetical protein